MHTQIHTHAYTNQAFIKEMTQERAKRFYEKKLIHVMHV